MSDMGEEGASSGQQWLRNLCNLVGKISESFISCVCVGGGRLFRNDRISGWSAVTLLHHWTR